MSSSPVWPRIFGGPLIGISYARQNARLAGVTKQIAIVSFGRIHDKSVAVNVMPLAESTDGSASSNPFWPAFPLQQVWRDGDFKCVSFSISS